MEFHCYYWEKLNFKYAQVTIRFRAKKKNSDGGQTRWPAKEIFARLSLVFDRPKYWVKVNLSLFNLYLWKWLYFTKRPNLRFTDEELAGCSRMKVCMTGQHDLTGEWILWPVKLPFRADVVRWPQIFKINEKRRKDRCCDIASTVIHYFTLCGDCTAFEICFFLR